jgi:hypothetical protein
MAPVKLRKREHQTLLEKELDLQVEEYVTAETGKWIPDGHEDAVLARLQKITESIKVHLRRNVEISEDLLKGTHAVQRGKWKDKQNLKDTSGECINVHQGLESSKTESKKAVDALYHLTFTHFFNQKDAGETSDSNCIQSGPEEIVCFHAEGVTCSLACFTCFASNLLSFKPAPVEWIVLCSTQMRVADYLKSCICC